MTNFEKLKADIQSMTVKEFAEKYYDDLDCPHCVYDSPFGCAFEYPKCVYDRPSGRAFEYPEVDTDAICMDGHIKWLESGVEE